MNEKIGLINNSGEGKYSQVSDDIAKRFNWGAFFFTFIWGIFNNTWITLIYLVLAFIPGIRYLNIFVSIWFGIKGNKWAWQNKKWKSITEFHYVQMYWAIASLVFFVLYLIIYLYAKTNNLIT